MRTHILLCMFTFLLAACTHNSGTKQAKNSDQEIRKQVIDIAESYAKNKLKGAKKTVNRDGSIIYSAGDVKCVINPSYILISEIDEDSTKDAIVSIFTVQGQRLPLKDHLIMINKNGKLSIAKEMNGEMKYLSISNRTIYIETSKMAPDSPFADCQLCKVIKAYKFIGGDTVGIK